MLLQFLVFLFFSHFIKITSGVGTNVLLQPSTFAEVRQTRTCSDFIPIDPRFGYQYVNSKDSTPWLVFLISLDCSELNKRSKKDCKNVSFSNNVKVHEYTLGHKKLLESK